MQSVLTSSATMSRMERACSLTTWFVDCCRARRTWPKDLDICSLDDAEASDEAVVLASTFDRTTARSAMEAWRFVLFAAAWPMR